MKFSVADYFGIYPNQLYNDDDETWAWFFNNAPVASKKGSCMRGAEFYPPDQCLDINTDTGLPQATAPNVMHLWGALYDVDDFEKRGMQAPSFQDIYNAFQGFRVIAWTSWSHLIDGPHDARYKVFVPFSRPVLPSHYGFFHNALRDLSGGLGVESQANVDRLAYMPRKRTPDAPFQYMIGPGPRLDPYETFGEPPEDWVAQYGTRRVVGAPDAPTRANWVSDEDAKERARRYFSRVGPEVGAGARHEHLMKWGCVLWWDFWLEEDDVTEILLEINTRFPEPKSHREVLDEVKGSYIRTRGDAAREQVDVEGNVKPAGCKREREPPPNMNELLDLAVRMKKATQSERKEQGRQLYDCLKPNKDGSLKAPEDPSSFYVEVATILGDELYEHDLSTLFEPMRVSWELYGSGDVTEEVLQQVIRESAKSKHERVLKELAIQSERKARFIKEAFATVGILRDSPYTNQEMETWADDRGITVAQLIQQLIIKVKSNYHFFINGSYTLAGFDRTSLVSKAKQMLSPVNAFEAQTINEKGMPVDKSITDLQDQYGKIVSSASYDLTRYNGRYESYTDSFVMAPVCWNRQVRPERSEFVDGFLKTFPDYHAICDWLSWVPDLNYPLQMLYLEGQASSGKSLFAKALSKIWSNTPQGVLTDMKGAVQRFHHDWVSCPLFVAEEKLPRELEKDSALFRSLITTSNLTMERKGADKMPVSGHVRFLVSANNSHAIPGLYDRTATQSDVDAIQERIFHVKLNESTKAYLSQFSRPQVNSLITDNLLANHVYWLAMHRKPLAKNAERFPVSLPISETVRQVGRSDSKELVLYWLFQEIAAMASSSTNALPGGSFGANAIDGRMYRNHLYIGINLMALKTRWKVHIETTKDVPGHQTLKAALEDMVHQEDGSGKRFRNSDNIRRYYIKPSSFMVFAEINDFSVEQLQENMVKFFDNETEKNPKLAQASGRWA